jgi:HEAT repeat protein
MGIVLGGCGIDPMEKLSEQINSQNLDERSQAITQLANLNDPRATDALIQVLDSDDKMGDEAAVALVKKGRERTTKQKPDPLLDAIAKVMGNLHTSEHNRARAAWALGEIGDRLAIPPLKAAQGGAKTAGGADSTLIRTYAQQALEKLGNETAGRAYEIPWGAMSGPDVVLPVPKPFPEEAKKPA